MYLSVTSPHSNNSKLNCYGNAFFNIRKDKIWHRDILQGKFSNVFISLFS